MNDRDVWLIVAPGRSIIECQKLRQLNKALKAKPMEKTVAKKAKKITAIDTVLRIIKKSRGKKGVVPILKTPYDLSVYIKIPT